MTTDFPLGESASVKIRTKAPKKFMLALRRPYWAGDGFSVKVNGQSLKDLSPADSYVKITRVWRQGDTVELTSSESAAQGTAAGQSEPDGDHVGTAGTGRRSRTGSAGKVKTMKRILRRPRLLRSSSLTNRCSNGLSRSRASQAGLRRPALGSLRISNLLHSTNCPAENTPSIGTFSLRKSGTSVPPNIKASRTSNRSFRLPRSLLRSRARCSRSGTSMNRERTLLRFFGEAATDARQGMVLVRCAGRERTSSCAVGNIRRRGAPKKHVRHPDRRKEDWRIRRAATQPRAGRPFCGCQLRNPRGIDWRQEQGDCALPSDGGE